MKKNDIIILVALLLAPIIVGVIQIAVVESGVNSPFSIFAGKQSKIGVIKVQGVIYSSDSFVSQLNKFRHDKNVSGVIIYINSPGGAVAPSQEIYEEIMRFRKDTEKTVYISMGTVAASGGYYIASAGDKIFANSGTLTGSIGVIMQLSHYHGLLEKVGVNVSTITAGQLKDAGSPYRELSYKEKKYFDDLLKDNHEQFISDICTARNMEADSLRQYAEGQIFTGNMALEHGLIDTIATYEECKLAICSALELPEDTKFISVADDELAGLSKLFESKASVKSMVNRVLPQSGVYYLATELQ